MTVDNLPHRTPTAFRSVGILCNSFGDPYTVPILHGAAKELSAQAFHTICMTGGYPNAPIYQGLDQSPAIPPFMDGLILLSATMRGYGRELEEMASSSPQAVVSIGAQIGQLPSIAANDETGIFQAVAHLVKRHDRKLIAFIGGPDGSNDGTRRQAAYRIALENFNLPCDPSLIARGDYEARSGREAVRALRQMSSKSFDAIVAANDLMAIGAMEGLQAAGIRVPKQVSVIGFDDMEEAGFTVPSLTTVRQPVYEQGISAAHLILRLLKGGTIDDQVTIIPTPLVLRHSCGCSSSDSGQRLALQPPDMLESYEKLEDAMRARIRRQLASQRQHRELSRLADRIVSVVDYPELATVMTDVFRLINVRRFLLCAYTGNQRHARVVLESAGRDVVFRNQSEAFPVEKLFPTGFLRTVAPLQLIVEPLQIGDEHFGYTVLEADVREGHAHLELRHFLTSAMSRIARSRELRRLYTIERKFNDLQRSGDSAARPSNAPPHAGAGAPPSTPQPAAQASGGSSALQPPDPENTDPPPPQKKHIIRL